MTFDEDLDRLCARLRLEQISLREFMDTCVRIAATHIGCSRVGIWIFRNQESDARFECLAMYDNQKRKLVKVPSHSKESAEKFFDALFESGVVHAADVHLHEATKRFFMGDEALAGVRSLMASSLSLNGSLFGALSCTQLGRGGAWNDRQVQMLRKMGARTTITLSKIVDSEKIQVRREAAVSN